MNEGEEVISIVNRIPEFGKERTEFKWLMVAITALLLSGFTSSLFPLLETIFSLVVLSLLVGGVLYFVARRLHDEYKLYRTLHDPIEKLLLEEENSNGSRDSAR